MLLFLYAFIIFSQVGWCILHEVSWILNVNKHNLFWSHVKHDWCNLYDKVPCMSHAWRLVYDIQGQPLISILSRHMHFASLSPSTWHKCLAYGLRDRKVQGDVHSLILTRVNGLIPFLKSSDLHSITFHQSNWSTKSFRTLLSPVGY